MNAKAWNDGKTSLHLHAVWPWSQLFINQTINFERELHLSINENFQVEKTDMSILDFLRVMG